MITCSPGLDGLVSRRSASRSIAGIANGLNIGSSSRRPISRSRRATCGRSAKPGRGEGDVHRPRSPATTSVQRTPTTSSSKRCQQARRRRRRGPRGSPAPRTAGEHGVGHEPRRQGEDPDVDHRVPRPRRWPASPGSRLDGGWHPRRPAATPTTPRRARGRRPTGGHRRTAPRERADDGAGPDGRRGRADAGFADAEDLIATGTTRTLKHPLVAAAPASADQQEHVGWRGERAEAVDRLAEQGAPGVPAPGRRRVVRQARQRQPGGEREPAAHPSAAAGSATASRTAARAGREGASDRPGRARRSRS